MPTPELRLVWFRNDLRLTDQVALAEAARDGPVIAVYCLCPQQLRAHDVGGNRVAFVLRCLAALRNELAALGVVLRILTPPDFAAVPAALLGLARETGATSLWFNDEYPLNEQRRDRAVTVAFESAGLTVHRFTDSVVRAPGTVLTGNGDPYVVFTPFRKRWIAGFDRSRARPLARPRAAQRAVGGEGSDPVPPMPPGFTETCDPGLWPGGEREAQQRLRQFLDEQLTRYARDRDQPALEATSRLSPYLSVGAISVRTCFDALLACNDGRLDAGDPGAVAWASELIWREFYRHVVAAFPHVSRGHAFRREYDDLPWRDDPAALSAWQEGRTGYPLIDAAMRQLRETGWMHNRLRMVVAMFLSKNLLLDWHLGERYFMEHLVDGDFAANNGGWQWSASTGTDAAPYFRVFSPASQSRRFDPDAAFIHGWLPALADVDVRSLHDPERGDGIPGYPPPIVDARTTRRRAIEVFRTHRSRV